MPPTKPPPPPHPPYPFKLPPPFSQPCCEVSRVCAVVTATPWLAGGRQRRANLLCAWVPPSGYLCFSLCCSLSLPLSSELPSPLLSSPLSSSVFRAPGSSLLLSLPSVF